jgi:hypothetical protein
MSEFFFVLKTALFSLVILFVLQFKVGGLSLEEHVENKIYRSRMGAEMKNVARGAVRAGHDGWSWMKFQARDKVVPVLQDDGSKQEINRERSARNHSRNDDLD